MEVFDGVRHTTMFSYLRTFINPRHATPSSRDKLIALGYNVEWHEYPMQHSVCAEEIQDIGAWLSRVLAS